MLLAVQRGSSVYNVTCGWIRENRARWVPWAGQKSPGNVCLGFFCIVFFRLSMKEIEKELENDSSYCNHVL